MGEDDAAESWEQVSSFVMAKQLEVDGLRRSLALSLQQLQVKSREAFFLKDCALTLGKDLQQSTSHRDKEVAGLLRAPLPPPIQQQQRNPAIVQMGGGPALVPVPAAPTR